MTEFERECAVMTMTDEEVVKLSTSELKYVCKHNLMRIQYKEKRLKRCWDPNLCKTPPKKTSLSHYTMKPILNRAGMSKTINEKRKTLTAEEKTKYLQKRINQKQEQIDAYHNITKDETIDFVNRIDIAKKISKLNTEINEFQTLIDTVNNAN